MKQGEIRLAGNPADPMTNPEDQKARELEACPFCESKRIVKGERYFAMCVDCGATGPERVRQSTSQAVYNGDWNTRPRERRLEELLRHALPACEYSAMKWKDKEGREDRVKLPSEINAALRGSFQDGECSACGKVHPHTGCLPE